MVKERKFGVKRAKIWGKRATSYVLFLEEPVFVITARVLPKAKSEKRKNLMQKRMLGHAGESRLDRPKYPGFQISHKVSL